MGSRCLTVAQCTLLQEHFSPMGNLVALLLVLVASLMSRVTCRHGRTLRQGSLSNDEMRIVHGMMEAMEDDGDMDNMEILPAPVSRHPARGSSDRCKLGSKSYCPGEILFKVGQKKLKAKMCTPAGKFDTVTIPANYQEPQRCQHRAVEYCDGESLRGFMAWSFVQQCRNGRLELLAMHHGPLMRVMEKLRTGLQRP